MVDEKCARCEFANDCPFGYDHGACADDELQDFDPEGDER